MFASADGQRFLGGTAIGDANAAAPTVILSGQAELKK